LEIDAPEEHAQAVRDMFSALAPRYDLLNHLLSLNADRSWRRRAVDRLGWEARPHGLYLDVCAGTFDLAIELCSRPGFSGGVIALDFSLAMLREGTPKITRHPVAPLCGDALRIPLASGSLEGAMVAFGVRNLADIAAGLRELKRVLRPGARLVILDFAMPTRRSLRWIYRVYFTRVLPFVGRLISKHSYAYTYLPESVQAFSGPRELGSRLEAVGYADVGWVDLSGGIASLWWGTRAEARRHRPDLT
jgi:demethylmenaquinone methyltransferase/2-methoxy-6-polyprenyl-1,4-benzoquinol methylase